MEAQVPETPDTVDASRPFRSVKEAVAIFGDRLLPREIQSSPKRPSVSSEKEILEETHNFTRTSFSSEKKTPHSSSEHTQSPMKFPITAFPSEKKTPHPAETTPSPINSPTLAGKEIVEYPRSNEPIPSPQNMELTMHGNVVHGNDLVMMLMVLKKLEAEVQDTKIELQKLKERESETEVALASLNAELHRNMSKIAMAEADEATKAMPKSKGSIEGGNREIATREDERSSLRGEADAIVKNMDSPTLAKILSITDYEGYLREEKKAKNKKMKKKPIIPLVTDIFPWKKRSSSPNPYLSGSSFSSHMYF